ncbi:unnamed protein product, partial [Prorocentrum cordatum]
NTQALSSEEAEYCGWATVAAEAIHVQVVMKFLDMEVKSRIRLDSSAAKAVCPLIGIGKFANWRSARCGDRQRCETRGAGDIEERKAERVNLMSDSTCKMAKVGAALVALLDSLGAAKREDAYDACGGLGDHSEIVMKDARLGTGVRIKGMMLSMVLVMTVVVVCAVGCCVGHIMKPSTKNEKAMVASGACIPRGATGAKKVNIETRAVS